MISTNNRFNRYDAILEELRNVSLGNAQLIRNQEQMIQDNRNMLNELRQLNSDRTNNRSRRREETEDENPAPFSDRERDHHHDDDLVK